VSLDPAAEVAVAVEALEQLRANLRTPAVKGR
jgi:hypothetical protein